MPRVRTSTGKTELSNQFDIHKEVVPEGVYLAKVVGCGTATFKGAKDPSAVYSKLTPKIILFNDNQTVIEQDIVLGQIDKDGVLFQPDPKKEAEGVSPVYTDALFFMSALGFDTAEEFAPELVTGQVIVVSVITEVYINRDGREGKKNRVGWRRSNGRIGAGFSRLNVEQESNAAWITEHNLLQYGNMWFVSDTDADAYDAALADLDSEEGSGDSDIL
jgi:hypothetical protein